METIYERLASKWVYNILESNHEDSVNLKILRSDFHGAQIKVIHSTVNSYIGIEGIVIN